MKLKLLRLLFMAVKLSTYGLVLQALFISVLYAHSGNAQYKKVRDVIINQNIKGLTIKEVFNLIEENSQLELFYIKEDLNSDVQMDLNTEKGISVYDLLMQVSKQSGLKFQQVNNSISASKTLANEKVEDIVQIEILKDVEISGKITDENGQGLPGASVVEKGTTNGTTTDLEGNYKLSTGEDAVLVISFVGYQTHEVNVAGRSTIDFQMAVDAQQLEDVVVVGYGTQKKANLTGSVVNVKGDDINKRPITQASQALQGMAPGVFVNTNSGEPGNDDASIVIRGIGTLNNAEPLILIDGIEGPINSVNPNDIESVNVLKDAASASIYGTRAANGVILITTKRGTTSGINVNYDFYTGTTSPTVLPDMVNDNRTYLETYRQAAVYSGRSHNITDALIDEYDALPSTDYLDRFVKNGSLTSHNFSISGGNKVVKYYWSGAYLDQESWLEGDYYLQRLNNRLNLDFSLSDKVRAGTSLSYTNADNRLTSKADGNVGVLGLDNPQSFNPYQGKGSFLFTNLIGSNPHVVPTDEFGRYGGLESRTARSSRYNPQGIADNEWINVDQNDFLGNVFIEYEPLEGLKFRYTGGINFQQQSFEETRLEFLQYNRFGDLESTRNQGSLLRTRESNIINFTHWLQASYEKSVNDHNFKLLVGANQETSDIRRIATYETGFGSTSLVVPGNGTTSDIANYNGEWVLASLFGRVNYDYKGKYLLELNVRRDGSSRFGSKSRWATFPGVSIGYVLSNEDFWSLDQIDLKIRGSWGKLGVQSANLYPFASEIILGEDYNGNSGAALTKLGNGNLQWEETTSTNIGIDVGLFKGKLSVEADYFIKESNNILTDLPNPLTSGVTAPISVNAASIENKGWDMALNYRGNIGRIKVNGGFNITNVKNQIVQLNPALTNADDKVLVDNNSNVWWIRGEAINAIYGHEFGGIFQTNEFNSDGTLADGTDYSWVGATPRPGDIKYTDQNNDGVINEDDMVVIGNRNPEWIYGFNLNLSYKGFDFSTLFQGTSEVNDFISRYTGNFGHAGLRRYYLDGWTEDNPSNEIPILFIDRDGFNGKTINGNGGLAQNSFWVVNKAYLRLKNISLGYTIPASALEKLPFSSVRIYVSGQNLWTNSDLEDIDPERADFAYHLPAALPQTKSYMVGLNVKF